MTMVMRTRSDVNHFLSAAEAGLRIRRRATAPVLKSQNPIRTQSKLKLKNSENFGIEDVVPLSAESEGLLPDIDVDFPDYPTKDKKSSLGFGRKLPPPLTDVSNGNSPRQQQSMSPTVCMYFGNRRSRTPVL